MGQLVAEAAGSQASALRLILLAEAVLGLHLHPLGALHKAPQAGHRQTALQAVLLSLLGHDLGVYQLQHLVGLVDDDNHPAQDAHLRGSQSHASGLSQGLLHIVDQVPQLLIKLGYGVAHLSEGALPPGQNLSNGHFHVPPLSHSLNRGSNLRKQICPGSPGPDGPGR